MRGFPVSRKNSADAGCRASRDLRGDRVACSDQGCNQAAANPELGGAVQCRSIERTAADWARVDRRQRPDDVISWHGPGAIPSVLRLA